MALKLFYITNRLDVALVAEKNGVDRIWVDLERLGKQERQPGNTVKSQHSIEDIAKIRPKLTSAEMLVRINPWNKDSETEIKAVLEAGADIIMLPFWKSVDEVKAFLEAVSGEAKTTLLLETKEAVECIDEVLKLEFDEIHIGLNDLHMSYGLSFMFELLANGTVEYLCNKFKEKRIPYGFGGIARLGEGLLPAEKIVKEHYRLGSTRAILSRSFCNYEEIENVEEVEIVFKNNLLKLREYEKSMYSTSTQEFVENKEDVVRCVDEIVMGFKERK